MTTASRHAPVHADGPHDALERARQQLEHAKTATELREALAVTLPNQLGLTLAATAQILGRSTSWVAAARKRLLRLSPAARTTHTHGGRRNQILPPGDEAPFMDEVCRVYIKIHKDWRTHRSRGPQAYAATHVRFEEHVRLALERHARRPIPRSSAYNLMARVGKQRFADYTAGSWQAFCARSF